MISFFELNYQFFKINFNVANSFQQHLTRHGMAFSASFENVTQKCRIMKRERKKKGVKINKNLLMQESIK